MKTGSIRACPICSSPDVAEVRAAPGRNVDDLKEKIRSGKIYLKKTDKNGFMPSWHCNYCRYEW